jgi:4-diphosphocytidyl-2-C-methyl-D-erythritol kinase
VDLSAASLAEHAPAKINLALHVTGSRPDGFHLIESLAVFTQVGDRVIVAAASEDSFSTSGPFGAEIPLDGGNLVVRARDVSRAAFPALARSSVSISVEKNLPIASGIGGGSSDAAATLRALVRYWRIETDVDALCGLGLRLGADLPMCLASRPLIARGIGEKIEPLIAFPALHMVLVNPGVAVSTPDVFRALESRENPGLSSLPSFDRPFGDVCGWLAATRNDLQAPAMSIVPVISEALEALESAGAGFARMSGSGATCFGLFETAGAAARATDEIRARQSGWWVVATESIASKDSAYDAV